MTLSFYISFSDAGAKILYFRAKEASDSSWCRADNKHMLSVLDCTFNRRHNDDTS